MTEKILTHEVTEGGGRLDKYIAGVWNELSRSTVQALIASGKLTVNDAFVKANYILRTGDIVEVELPEPESTEVIAENMPLDVIYEDSDIIVVNKPRGMVVHPAVGNYTGTLVNALLYHCKDLSGIGGVVRPGIVHRLDKDTTGLIIAAKNDRAHVLLQELWQTGDMNRWYTALVYGSMSEPAGRIEAPIGRHPSDRKKMAVTPGKGRYAATNYQVLQRLGSYTLLEAKLETGRTHQIRVHMNYLGHSVVGDVIYGHGRHDKSAPGLLLHSAKMEFPHPVTGEMMKLSAPLPQDFEGFCSVL